MVAQKVSSVVESEWHYFVLVMPLISLENSFGHIFSSHADLVEPLLEVQF